MILKASTRGGAKQLALHLLSNENEHVGIHELSGVVSDNLQGALQEMYAVSKGTQAKKFMLSLSLNPPAQEKVNTQDFENAITRIEDKLGLTGQPRAIVFHEKNDRRHCHCVWSRIDGHAMKAIKLDYYKKQLNGIAKDLYLEHGWKLPKGFIHPALSNPLNYSLDEYQQAKRDALDPKEVKAAIQQSWKQSDNKTSFTSALADKGFFLAKGDKRGFVVISWRGGIYALSRSIKSKELKARLGKPDTLPSVAQTQEKIKAQQDKLHKRFKAELRAKHDFAIKPLIDKREALKAQQQAARQNLKQTQNKRFKAESSQRQQSLRKGLMGLWDFMTGKSRKQKQAIEEQAIAAKQRDKAEQETLIQHQLIERQTLRQELQALRDKQTQEQMHLQQEINQPAHQQHPTINL